MGRWSHLDTDAERLPENMTRIAYDSDTQVYTYRDNTDGSLWEGAPGATYGKLFPVKPPTPLPSVKVPEIKEGDEPEYVLEEGPDPFGDHNAVLPDTDEKKGGTRKRVDSVIDRIASVTEKPSADRRPSRRESRREAGYDEKGLERNISTTKKGHAYSMTEKETLSRSSTTRTSRTNRTGASPSWDPRPSSSHGQQAQEDGNTSKLKRAGTLSRLSRFLTGKRKEDDPDFDVTPGTTGPEWAANGSRVHRSKTVSAPPRTQPETGTDWNRTSLNAGTGTGTGRRKRATTFDEILAGIPGQH